MRSKKRVFQNFVYLLLMTICGRTVAADDQIRPPCYVDKPNTTCAKALELVAPEYEWLTTCGGCKENHIDPNDPDSPLDPFFPYKCITSSSENLYLASEGTIHFYEKVNTGGQPTISEDDMPIPCGVIARCGGCVTRPEGRVCTIEDFGAPPFEIDVRHVTGPACRSENPDLPGGE